MQGEGEGSGVLVKGQTLIHKPTNRPVVVKEVTEEGFTVCTLDDTWIHPKTGKRSGGCAWVLGWDTEKDFEKVK